MATPSPVRVTGPLAPYAEGFRAELIGQGYTPLSARNQLWVMAHLSRWLEGDQLEAAELTPARVREFLHTRRIKGYTKWLSERGVAPLLSYLRGLGVTPPPAETVVESPLQELLDAYRSYLVHERGLAETTVYRYQHIAHLFLAEQSDPVAVDLESLGAAEVAEFTLRVCREERVANATNMVTALRSLLRFLHLQGSISRPLAAAVPAVARWKGSSLPRALDPSQVAQLLGSC
ncbi:MAG: site-specific integrase, partial [Actinomycetota bacterium]